MDDPYLHEVAITAIIVRDGRYLITRRSRAKRRFPGVWTVPGGRLEVNDYIGLPKETQHYWYNIIERVLRREVKEEVDLEIQNIQYLTSAVTIHGDDHPSLVISCSADYLKGEVSLQKEEADKFEWVTLAEAKDYELLDGIYDEMAMFENKKEGSRSEWARTRK